VIALFATDPTPKRTGVRQDVPAAEEPELATKNPLSTAPRWFVTFSAPPISAWYVVGVTTIVVAETATMQRTRMILAEKYQVNVRRSRLLIFDALSIFALLHGCF